MICQNRQGMSPFRSICKKGMRTLRVASNIVYKAVFDRELAYVGGIQGVSKTATDTAIIYGNTDSGGSTTLSILPPYITFYM